MKRLLRYTALAVLLIVPLALVACGGDDDDGDSGGDNGGSTSRITTSKGLTLPAINAGFGNLGGGTGGEEAAGDTALRTGGSQAMAAAAPAKDLAATGGDKAPQSGAVQQQAGTGGITVSGYGTARAEADSAVIEFYFGSEGGAIPVPEPGFDDSGSAGSGVAGASPITEEQLQPVIDALVAAGVSADDIEFISQGYYDPYYSSATLRAAVRDIDILETAANAAAEAADNLDGIALQNTSITYTMTDCAAMERAALETAAADAADHAQLLADVLGLGLGGIVAASDYSYPYYYGLYYGAGEDFCASSYYGAIPMVRGAALGGSRTVEVFASVSITYAIQ